MKYNIEPFYYELIYSFSTFPPSTDGTLNLYRRKKPEEIGEVIGIQFEHIANGKFDFPKPVEEMTERELGKAKDGLMDEIINCLRKRGYRKEFRFRAERIGPLYADFIYSLQTISGHYRNGIKS